MTQVSQSKLSILTSEDIIYSINERNLTSRSNKIRHFVTHFSLQTHCMKLVLTFLSAWRLDRRAFRLTASKYSALKITRKDFHSAS